MVTETRADADLAMRRIVASICPGLEAICRVTLSPSIDNHAVRQKLGPPETRVRACNCYSREGFSDVLDIRAASECKV
jgi:hypothetical protein